jgi:hypothetical protein
MNPLQNIYYRLKTALFFSTKFDPVLDTRLSYLIQNEAIKSYKKLTKYRAEVIFNCGARFEFWNTTKFSNWLVTGMIKSNAFQYHYSGCRPSAKTIYEFNQKLILFKNGK